MRKPRPKLKRAKKLQVTVAYGWKDGTRLRRLDPQAVGEEIRGLPDRSAKGVVRHVEEMGRASALYDGFTWDAKKALQKCHLEEAHYILRSIVVLRVKNVSTPPSRGFMPLRRAEEDADADTQYVHTPDAFRDPTMRTGLLEAALAELRVFKRKYACLQEFARLIDEIDNVLNRA